MNTLVASFQSYHLKVGSYFLVKKLIQGEVTSVWLVQDEENNFYAMKCIPRPAITELTIHERLESEIRIMRTYNHPKIEKIIDVFCSERHVHIVKPFCQGGDLLSEIWRRNGIKEDHARDIFRQMTEVLDNLHSNNIAHRDIKPENVLYMPDGTIRLTDFGFSAELKEIRTSDGAKTIVDSFRDEYCGTLHYSAPELVENENSFPYCTLRADIWARGVSLYFMVTGKQPFSQSDEERLRCQILYAPVPYPDSISPELVDLLRKILQKDPSDRATLHEIMSHTWMEDIAERIPPQLHILPVESVAMGELGVQTNLDSFGAEGIENCLVWPTNNWLGTQVKAELVLCNYHETTIECAPLLSGPSENATRQRDVASEWDEPQTIGGRNGVASSTEALVEVLDTDLSSTIDSRGEIVMKGGVFVDNISCPNSEEDESHIECFSNVFNNEDGCRALPSKTCPPNEFKFPERRNGRTIGRGRSFMNVRVLRGTADFFDSIISYAKRKILKWKQ